MLFRQWLNKIYNNAELIAIQLPGRDHRYKEPFMDNMFTLVKSICDSITAYADKPAVLFGHSLGGLISFEIAREFRRRNFNFIKHLIISATRPPHMPNHNKKAYHLMSDEEFTLALNKYKGTPDIILQNQELMQVLLPRLRSDFALYEKYQYVEEEPLPCSATVLYGSKDSLITNPELSAWQRHFVNPINIHTFDGDHFFITSHVTSLLQTINNILKLYAH